MKRTEGQVIGGWTSGPLRPERRPPLLARSRGVNTALALAALCTLLLLNGVLARWLLARLPALLHLLDQA